MDSLEEPVCLEVLLFCCFAIVASHIPEKLPVADVDHHPIIFPAFAEKGYGVNVHHRGFVWEMANYFPHHVGRGINSLGCCRGKESVEPPSLQLVGQPKSSVGPYNSPLAASSQAPAIYPAQHRNVIKHKKPFKSTRGRHSVGIGPPDVLTVNHLAHTVGFTINIHHQLPRRNLQKSKRADSGRLKQRDVIPAGLYHRPRFPGMDFIKIGYDGVASIRCLPS